MKLYGSNTSPYVRRLKLLLENTDYEYINLNIFENKDRETLRNISPVLKIPVLEDAENIIFDSRVIFNYLINKGVHRKLNTDEENLLTVIDGINDSLINFLLLLRSNVTLTKDSVLHKSVNERVSESLGYLETQIDSFKDWNYLSICLYCLIDWINFRDMYDLSGYSKLNSFFDKHRDKKIVITTNPRSA